MTEKISKKEAILKEAFKLFLAHGFDAVSLSDIEKAANVTRGNLFFHYKSKQEIYELCIAKYIFQFLDNKPNISISKSSVTPLTDFIKALCSAIKLRMSNFKTQMDNVNTSANFFRLVSSAKGNFPEFEEKLMDYDAKEELLWEQILTLSVEKQEIRTDINIKQTVSLFRHAYIGLAYRQSLMKGLDVQELKNIWSIIYNSIKKT